MARRFLRLDVLFATHPKVVELSDRAFRAYVSGLCYSAQHLTDGAIPATTVRLLSTRRTASELIDAGLWDQNGSGVVVHDFLDWQESRAEVEELSSKRADAGRRGGRGRKQK